MPFSLSPLENARKTTREREKQVHIDFTSHIIASLDFPENHSTIIGIVIKSET